MSKECARRGYRVSTDIYTMPDTYLFSLEFLTTPFLALLLSIYLTDDYSMQNNVAQLIFSG